MRERSGSHYRKFVFIWSGQLFSILGSGMSAFALGVYAFEKTHSASVFSLLVLCYFLPPFLFRPVGGILADRFDRRLIMVIGDFGSALGIIFIFLIMQFWEIKIWHICTGISFSSLFTSLQEPAFKSSVTDFLSPDEYAKASGLMQFAHASQHLLSPFIAGLLLTIINLKFIFIIDISTFLTANIIVLAVRKSLVSVKRNRFDFSMRKDFSDGINEFLKNKNVVLLVIITSLVLYFIGLMQALFAPMILSFTTSGKLGVSQSVCASGMILGSLFLGIFGSKKNQVTVLAVSLFLTGIFFSGIGISINLVFISVSGFLFFSTLPFVNTSIEVMIRNVIDNEKQGRVWAIISSLTYFGSILAFCTAGFLADRIFNPLLKENGKLAKTIGTVIGTGNGRGIGLIFIISGIMISMTAISVKLLKSIGELEIEEKQ